MVMIEIRVVSYFLWWWPAIQKSISEEKTLPCWTMKRPKSYSLESFKFSSDPVENKVPIRVGQLWSIFLSRIEKFPMLKRASSQKRERSSQKKGFYQNLNFWSKKIFILPKKREKSHSKSFFQGERKKNLEIFLDFRDSVHSLEGDFGAEKNVFWKPCLLSLCDKERISPLINFSFMKLFH